MSRLIVPVAIAAFLVAAAAFGGVLRPSAPSALAVPAHQEVTNATRPKLSVVR